MWFCCYDWILVMALSWYWFVANAMTFFVHRCYEVLGAVGYALAVLG